MRLQRPRYVVVRTGGREIDGECRGVEFVAVALFGEAGGRLVEAGQDEEVLAAPSGLLRADDVFQARDVDGQPVVGQLVAAGLAQQRVVGADAGSSIRTSSAPADVTYMAM